MTVLNKDCLTDEDTTIWADCDIEDYENFSKENKDSRVWWTGKLNEIGPLYISFDKKKIYNLFEDYPYNMTIEEIEILEKRRYFESCAPD